MQNDPNNNHDRQYPTEFRRDVSSENQIQLPKRLVREVAYEGFRQGGIRAMACWYYHAAHDKMVLSDKSGNRPSLELIARVALSGITPEEVEGGNPSGARVRVVTALPDDLQTMLTRDSVVLKPVYQEHHPQLDSTYVSVYPAAAYDRGELPNVDHELNPRAGGATDANGGSKGVGTYDGHMNTI